MTLRTLLRTAPLAGLLVAAAALAAAAPASGPATEYRPLPSKVTVSGTSTLHDWHVESAKVEGRVAVAAAFLAGEAAALPTVEARIPVASLASGKKKMDELMHDALEARAHPAIEYRLTAASVAGGAGGATTRLATRGRLTIAGETREVPMEVEVTRQADGRLVVRGSIPLAMTDFGVEPPTAMLGTIKTGDRVTVGFEWTLAAAAGSGR